MDFGKIIKKCLLTLFLLALLPALFFYQTPKVQQALASTCPTSGSIITDSLVSAGSTATGGQIYSTIGTCVVDSQASFVTFKIPTYDELKSVYYTQAKTTATVQKHDPSTGLKFNQNDIPLDQPYDHIYYLTGNLTISGPLSGSKTGIIFVDGDLNINNNLSYGTGVTGVVFIVKGNINIDLGVTLVNAVLIGNGTICTAYQNGCPTGYSDPTNTSQLVVNGSLISLSADTASQKMIFRRNILDNSQPAEKINQQAKYLVILKNLFSQTLSLTSEDTNYSIGLTDSANQAVGQLTASCTVTPNPVVVGSQASWTVSASPDFTTYSYTWSGTDFSSTTHSNTFLNADSLNMTYDTVGTKNTIVNISAYSAVSGQTQTISTSCPSLSVNKS